MLVLDEADDMILHFYDTVGDLKTKLGARKGADKLQVLMFSASFECLEPAHPEVTRARDFTDVMLDRKTSQPVFIRVTVDELRNEYVTHFVAKLDEAKDAAAAFKIKLAFLVSIYETLTVGKTMIFVNVRVRYGARRVGCLRGAHDGVCASADARVRDVAEACAG